MTALKTALLLISGIFCCGGDKRDRTADLLNAIQNDSDENVCVYYVNKEKTIRILQEAGNPISGSNEIPDGFIHCIHDPGSPVNFDVSKETKTRQFKQWFGDWENDM